MTVDTRVWQAQSRSNNIADIPRFSIDLPRLSIKKLPNITRNNLFINHPSVLAIFLKSRFCIKCLPYICSESYMVTHVKGA